MQENKKYCRHTHEETIQSYYEFIEFIIIYKKTVYTSPSFTFTLYGPYD